MTYLSETLAFKKAEILKVMQSIDPNFDLGVIQKIDANELTESIKYKNETTFHDYRKFLFRMPLLSLWEAASIICEMDPALLDDLSEYDARAQYPALSNAINFINASSEAGLIEFCNYKISKQEFQLFLSSQNLVIPGYNQTIIESNQNSDNTDLKVKYDHLLRENDILKKQLKDAEECIRQFKIEQSDKNNLLDLIFDDSITDRYAPDLVLSIKLWESIYILNPRDDSHSNKANNWITANTGYDQSKPSATKLREITTPFINWSTHRDKNYKK